MAKSDKYLSRLTELWAPPNRRNHTGEGIGFEVIERELGLALPDSFKSLTHAYGHGVWFETIYVLNPFFAQLNDLQPWMSYLGYAGGPSWCLRLQESREEYPSHIRSPIYPEPGGLFPWAFLRNGGVLYWVTSGTPSHWKTLHDRDLCFESEWESFELSVTELLWQLASKGKKVADTELDARIASYRSTVFETW